MCKRMLFLIACFLCCSHCFCQHAYACHVTDVCVTKVNQTTLLANFTYQGGGTESFGVQNCIFSGTTLPAGATSSNSTTRKAACDKGQGQTFASGTHNFTIQFPSSGSITWQMPNGTKVTASSNTKQCPCVNNAVRDACGVCGGDGSSCSDCSGVPNGTKSIDECGVCLSPSDPSRNKSCLDCKGIIKGTTKVDLCGVCGGDSSTCKDCAGVPNGKKVIDLCGVCGGCNDTCLDCAGTPNGSASIDACGICGGTNACNDCAGIPNGGTKLDRCGVCGGNGSSCRECKPTDITGLHAALDSAALSQKRVVNSLVSLVLRNKKAPAKTKAAARLLLAEAINLYQANWNIAWSIPSVIISCDSADGCQVVDVQSKKVVYLQDATRLRDIGNRLAKTIKRLRHGKLTKQDKKVIAAIKIHFDKSVALIVQVPDQSLQCVD